jgi:hypothetical protein
VKIRGVNGDTISPDVSQFQISLKFHGFTYYEYIDAQLNRLYGPAMSNNLKSDILSEGC